jgi:hypothetical protein
VLVWKADALARTLPIPDAGQQVKAIAASNDAVYAATDKNVIFKIPAH